MSRKTEGSVDWAKLAHIIDKDWDRTMNQTEYGRLFSPPLNQGQISKLLNQRYSRLDLDVADALRGRFGEIPRRRPQLAPKALRRVRGEP